MLPPDMITQKMIVINSKTIERYGGFRERDRDEQKHQLEDEGFQYFV